MSERIQKVLATAGVASRREIERLIADGKITVNGRPATVGQKISHTDRVRVDGRAVALPQGEEAVRVLLFRKRVGEMVTRDDPEGRRTVFRKLPELDSGRWIAVGRLDINTSGLLLMTNSGELARRLTHPSFEMVRTYAARVLGTVDAQVLQRLRTGVELDDGPARFTTIEPGENEAAQWQFDEAADDGAGPSARPSKDSGNQGKANHWFTVTVMQGRNRVVRRLFESQKLQVNRLIRTGYGPMVLGRGIKTGSYREATPEEIAEILEAVGMEAGAKPRKKTPAPMPNKRRR